MTNEHLVSIIVPVYKVEKYLHECVDSLIEQTYENIEIILVDDKSPDKSGAICDELAKKDERISVIHKTENEGLNMARKTGFDESHGRYVTFLDSDDYFYKDNVECSLKALLEANADVAIYGSREFSDHNKKDEAPCPDMQYVTKTLTTKKQKASYVFHGGENLPEVQYITVWGKLYAREVVEGVDWKAANYRVYEDNFWTPQALLKSSKIVVMSNQLIYYRRNVEYGAHSENLGNRLTGNSVNGEAVGYIEFVELVRKFYSKLARDNGLGPKLDEETNRRLFLIKSWRVDNLAKAGLMNSENNMEFITPFLQEYIVAKNQHIKNLDATIAYLDGMLKEREAKVIDLEAKVADLSYVLEELRGIKPSIKLAAKNIKRKITNSKD